MPPHRVSRTYAGTTYAGDIWVQGPVLVCAFRREGKVRGSLV